MENFNFCSLFINKYFDIGFLTWEANFDIQPEFDYHNIVMYMGGFQSKQEDKCSQAMNQAFKESLENGAGSYEQVKSLTDVYASKRECSLQEAVYKVIPEFSLESFCRSGISKQ